MASGPRLLGDLRRTERLPVYNEEAVRACVGEVQKLAREMAEVIETSSVASWTESTPGAAYMTVHRSTIKRNKRCLVAYHHERADRINSLRFLHGPGATLRAETRSILAAAEVDYFREYANAVDAYIAAMGIDLSSNLEAPFLVVSTLQVRALRDCGEVFTTKGLRILRQGDQLTMSRSDAEPLIQAGMIMEVSTDDRLQ